MKIMNARLEDQLYLTTDEQTAVRAARNGCSVLETLDEVEANLRSLFPGWFVYRGGSHVALHRGPSAERVMLVREEQPRQHD